MKILNLKDKNKMPCALALGYFDGVHLGHRQVIEKAVSTAREKGLVSAVFTFSGKLKRGEGNIYDMKMRQKLIADLGVDFLLAPDFNNFCNLSPKEFFKTLTENFSVDVFCCGSDFRFGNRASGTTETLKELCDEFNKTLIVAEDISVNGEIVSSTSIRAALKNGDIKKANLLLGKPYTISSMVEGGKHIGSQMLYPTVNQYYKEDCIVPKFGVYASSLVLDGKKYPAITNIGICPTVKTEEKPVAETYIIDKNINLYGEEISVSLFEFIRGEKKFNDVSELKKQITSDIEKVKNSFSKGR